MSIEYIIDDSCSVKNKLSLDGFLGLIKKRNMVNTVVEMLKGQGKSYEEALELSFSSNRIMSDRKLESKTLKVSEILQETMNLDELDSYCDECYLSNGNKFGCYHCVNFPISLAAEKWLVSIANFALTAKDGLSRMAIDFIIENGISGEKFRKMRNDKSGAFFKEEKELEISYDQKLFIKRKISTNQLFEILFGYQVIERPQQIALLYFTGCFNILEDLPNDKEWDKIIKITHSDGKVNWYVFNLNKGKDDDLAISQLKEFFNSIFLAYCTGKNIYIDF